MPSEYTDYYKNHAAYQNGLDEAYLIAYYQKNITPFLPSGDKMSFRVLEIGCGKGTFAQYCMDIGVSEYYGFDLDESVIEQNKNRFSTQKNVYFSTDDVREVMEPEKFDLVFLSHVFEHFTDEDAEAYAKNICKTLKKGGKYINVMPNGGSLFSSSIGRFADITHKKLYTEVSFTQILANGGFSLENINSYNSKSGPYIISLFRKLLKTFIKLLIKLMGYPVSQIDTFEIITVAKK